MPDADRRAAGIVGSRGGRPVRWAATDRSGGVSAAPFDALNLADHVGDDPAAVAANRALVAGWFGAADLATMGPVHGAAVAEVTSPGVVLGVDAVLTRTPGLVLLAVAADCVPLGLVGDDWHAVVHCGWQGLLADVVGAAYTAMAVRGDPPRAAVLGAAVCGRCYPVSVERAERMRTGVPAPVAAAAVGRAADGQPSIDVRAGLIVRLRALGVADIVDLGGCTVEDPRLFSYRRDGRTGRQGLAMCRQDVPVQTGEG